MKKVMIGEVEYVPKMESTPSLKFKEMLKEHRKKHNLTLQEAGDLVGCSKSFFHDMETGKCEPGLNKLKMIHLNLRIPAVDLLLSA